MRGANPAGSSITQQGERGREGGREGEKLQNRMGNGGREMWRGKEVAKTRKEGKGS